MMAITLLCLNDDMDSCGGLFDLVSAAGMGAESTSIATHPVELLSMASRLGIPKVLIIDCVEHAVYDVLRLISIMRAQRNLGIMVGVHNHRQRLAALNAGADIAFRLPIHPSSFTADVHDLAALYDSADVLPVAESTQPASTATPLRVEAPKLVPALANIVHLASVRTERNQEDQEEACAQECPAALPPPQPQPTPIGPGPQWQLVSTRSLLRSPEGASVRLTRQEYDFCKALFDLAPNCLTYQAWAGSGWTSEAGNNKALASIASRLRRKCAQAGLVVPIGVSRGNGYVFLADCGVVRHLSRDARQSDRALAAGAASTLRTHNGIGEYT